MNWLIKPVALFALTTIAVGTLSSCARSASQSGAKLPPPPPAVIAPISADDQLDSQLAQIGATRDDRGWVIALIGAKYRPGQVDFESSNEQRIKKVAELLKANDYLRAVVEAHTDNRGAKSLNKEVSQVRAEEARRRLTELGVQGGQVQAEGRGEDSPIADNDTVAGRLRNRRVEIVLSDAEGHFARSIDTASSS